MTVVSPKDRPALAALEQTGDFIGRHIGPSDADLAAMLDVVGAPSLEALVDSAAPDAIRLDAPLDLGPPQTERETARRLAAIAARNRPATSMIGMGYYGTVTPPVIRRNVFENPGWYTAYTPYQPEISQGRLEALLIFQTMVEDLTGMDVANASLLDEATAAAEAMAMAHRVAASKGGTFFVSEDCHPQTIAVVRTRAGSLGIDLVIGPAGEAAGRDDLFGALVQYPDTWGGVGDHRTLAEALHAKGALLVAAADLLALTLLTPPGEWGADIVVGSAQRFGVPMAFGGPHAAFLACADAHKRSMPGRLVGVSIDAQGRQALRLALQTREQHIRRERATSNICTAQVLLAVMAGLYAVYHGPEGLTVIARRVHRMAAILAAGLEKLGFKVETAAFFDTLTVSAPGKAEAIVAQAASLGLNLRPIDGDRLGLSVDETTVRADVDRVWRAFAGGDHGLDLDALDAGAADRLPADRARSSDFLTHPAFHSYRSETEMMRYLRRLQGKDIALDTAMIPLGSCTMKLNAATEMEPVSWPNFADLHPFAPREQTEGYGELIDELEAMLCAITGFDAFSFQPNAGSQGEYSGLLTIRAYQASQGQGQRDVCLIPSSAHGTNPASAVLAGLKVVVVDCDDNGNIDVADLRAKAAEHKDALAALMVTYPSTHGVFEEAIVEICDIVHGAGGQVYMDGANLNALVGVGKPGKIGADVAHLNLHKTFCIPHGGGGPGVGPIGVRSHLAPFLPGHPLRPDCGGDRAIGPVSAAPWGSPGILPISWAYIHLMGAEGLIRATQVAILSANYVATRLGEHFPVLYRGKNGRVAHECIIDLRDLKKFVSVDDVAKRLIDYGFHAPTMSFPVAGTLMIEPTESEPKAELDRFCDAMIAIRQEIRAIETGEADAQDNVLANAPHTAEDVTADAWSHPYSREAAAYPAPALRAGKYWSPVSRIDQVYGDRHVVCSCPPMEAYKAAAE